MSPADRIDDEASVPPTAARRLQHAALEPGSRGDAARALGRLEEALQALSSSWCQVAADAGPASQRRRPATPASSPTRGERGLSREREVRLIGALGEVAAALARCARICRDVRPVVTELVEPRPRRESDVRRFPRFERYERPTGRAA